MSEDNPTEAVEDDAVEMIYEHQEEQISLDTVNKLENREDHSVLEADMVKGEPLYPHEMTRDAVLTLYILALLIRKIQLYYHKIGILIVNYLTNCMSQVKKYR